MKRSAVRILTLLLAMLLAGVFAVSAEGYVEYSGGLSVADARAANGYDTDVYVCVDGAWIDIGDMLSTEVDVRFSDTYVQAYDAVNVSDLPPALATYGFTTYSAGDICFAVSMDSNAEATIDRQDGWGRSDVIPLGTTGGEYSDNGSSFRLYYVPVWPDMNNYYLQPSELANTNSFYSITVNGLSDADLATVDYGEAYDTAQGHLVFSGHDVTITVPSGYTWDYGTMGYTGVTVTDTAAGTTLSFTGVTGPLTLTAQALQMVNVTVQQLGLDGSVIASQTYEVAAGGTLPAEALEGYDSQYKWYDEGDKQISNPSALTFTADTTITTKPGVYKNNVGAVFYIYLDGRWQQVGETDTLYGRYTVSNGSRYLISASQLEAAFGPYGFDADSYTNPTDRRFGYSSTNGSTMWADTTSFVYYGEWVLPLSPGITQYAIYYLPDNEDFLNSETISNKAEENGFWTITFIEAKTDAMTQIILEEETVLSDWLAENAAVTLPGFEHPIGSYVWNDAQTGASLEGAETAQSVHTLTAVIPVVTVTLEDETGAPLAVIDDVKNGTSVAAWLKENDGLVLDNGVTVHEYAWSLPNETAISSQVFQQNTTLVGRRKPLYTVAFVDKRPGETQAGGSFVNGSEAYTTINVLEGDCIPAEFIVRMQHNIQLDEDWAFVEWQYEGNEGYLVMDAKTPIVKDTIVWADYTQEVYVRFWTDRNKTAQFVGSGLENQPVGKKYGGAVPDSSAVLEVAPVENMRFRYWYDLNSGTVFTPATDQVKDNLDLYPVFERAIFEFKDRDDGHSLAVLYDGSALQYEAEERENQYFAGLEVSRNDGTPHVIPNGTEITREYLTTNGIPVPEQEDGRYILLAKPVYREQRTVIYHTGEDAQFIIYGAEGQESYTVKVDDSVTLLGALDIINVASPIGLALDGWTTTPEGTQVQFAPNASFEGGTELDMLVGAGETVHLYPVWAQQDNTIAITFVSNYPADAVDGDNNALTERRYTVYIKEGSKPTMPTLARADMQSPANLCNGTQQRYVLAGWSMDQDGNLGNNGADANNTYTEIWGTYTAGSQYLHPVTEERTFYAIWVDRAPEEGAVDAYFHIRLDGTLPVEPSQHPQSGYLPGTCSGSNAWLGKIKKQINVVNNVAEVEANVLVEADIETIYDVLCKNDKYKDKFANLKLSDYGVLWYIDWYACKYACGKHYHVDGRVRFADQVELNYHPNGGSNVPAGTVHDRENWADVNKTQEPVRENFIFIGWDEDPAAKVPDYPANGLSFPTSPNLDEIWMDTDKDLYAIWQPVEITIPMDDDFKGQKYEQTNNGVLTPPQQSRTYQFTIEAIELPEGAAPYEKRTVTCKADGSFTFPQIHVLVEGMYVFEVREVIGDLAVQYDAAVYRLTINIVESDYGLGIAGYSFTRNNKVITVADNNVDNVVFTFVNRTDIRSVTATKVWDDVDNQDGLRPASVNVTLRRRGDSLFSEPATLTAAGGWTWTWEKLDIKDASSGEIYEYYITEDAVQQYTTTYSGDMNSGLIVTNTYQPKTVDFRVVKHWQGDDSARNLRPETLTYILVGSTADGRVVSTTVSDPVPDPWSYLFADMPLYDQGQQLHYTLSEAEISGYEASIVPVRDGNGGAVFNVTNTLTAMDVSIGKRIEGNAARMDDTFTFTARVYDAAGLLVTDVPSGEGYTVQSDGTVTFTLGHEQSVLMKLLPLGGSLVVTEESGAYTATFSPAGTQTDEGMRYEITPGLQVMVTNKLETPIPTGVNLDTAPYLLLLGLAAPALAWMLLRRRRA